MDIPTNLTVEQIIEKFKGDMGATEKGKMEELSSLEDALKMKAYNNLKEVYAREGKDFEFYTFLQEGVWHNKEVISKVLNNAEFENYLFSTNEALSCLTDDSYLTDDGFLISTPSDENDKVIAICYDLKGHNIMQLSYMDEDRKQMEMSAYHKDRQGAEYHVMLEGDELNELPALCDMDDFAKYFSEISDVVTLSFLQNREDHITSFDVLRLKEKPEKLTIFDYDFEEYVEDYIMGNDIIDELIKEHEGSLDNIDVDSIEYKIVGEDVKKLGNVMPLGLYIGDKTNGRSEYQPLPLLYALKTDEVLTLDEFNNRLPSIDIEVGYHILGEEYDEVHDELEGNPCERLRKDGTDKEETFQFVFFEKDLLKAIGFSTLDFDKEYVKGHFQTVDEYGLDPNKELDER